MINYSKDDQIVNTIGVQMRNEFKWVDSIEEVLNAFKE